MRSNELAIEYTGGSGNITYHLSQIKSSFCSYHVIFDNDASGIFSKDRAVSDGFIDESQYTLTVCSGLNESEIEDCIDENVWMDAISSKFGIRSYSIQPQYKKMKWSKRMEVIFKNNGKTWNDEIEKEVKIIVANCVSSKPGESLNQMFRAPIDSLASSLEILLSPDK